MIEVAGSNIDGTAILMIVGATAIGGFLRGFVGFGGALALVPALALALGPRVAVAVASLVGLPAVLQLLPEALRYADRRRVAPIALAILTAAPLGSLVLTRIDQRIMTGAIGCIVMSLALLTWKAPKGELMRKRWVGLAAGAVSGMLQGAAGIGGPPSVAVLMAQGGEPRRLRADVLAVTGAIALCGAASHFSFGLFTHKALVLALTLLPIFVGCTWLGTRFFQYGGSHYFRAAALAILMVIGFAAVGGALKALILELP
ncbi:MAG: sulfite exporter TauE/SafE family protein [Hyphomicrobiaceae bacterium]